VDRLPELVAIIVADAREVYQPLRRGTVPDLVVAVASLEFDRDP
jgi:hypothetical protein